MEQTHGSRIEAAFTKQAGTFEQADLNVAFTSGLNGLLSLAAADPLDVAGGAGLVARALAPSVESVTVVDATFSLVVTRFSLHHFVDPRRCSTRLCG